MFTLSFRARISLILCLFSAADVRNVFDSDLSFSNFAFFSCRVIILSRASCSFFFRAAASRAVATPNRSPDSFKRAEAALARTKSNAKSLIIGCTPTRVSQVALSTGGTATAGVVVDVPGGLDVPEDGADVPEGGRGGVAVDVPAAADAADVCSK